MTLLNFDDDRATRLSRAHVRQRTLNLTLKRKGTGCGFVGRVVAADIRGLRFESGLRQILCHFLF